MFVRCRSLMATALLLATAPHALIACATTPATLRADPRAWSAVSCATCESVGITVETRRSVTLDGKTGRYVFARVSNRNPFPVTFTLALVADLPHTGDPDFQTRQLRVSLPAGGEVAASTTVTLDHHDIAVARVSGVEKH
jgi:hypothetical protein